MPTSFPTFVDEEILAAAKLNAFVLAVSSRFTSLTGANLSYPLVLGGNIDFNHQHTIVGLRTFWDFINAEEYPTVQAAIDAAEAAGGGTVLIPPDTTLVADGLTIDADNIYIVGGGPSSVLQLTPGSTSGFLARTSASGISGTGFANLTLDGRSTGTGQKGVIFRRVTEPFIHNVRAKNFTGDVFQYTNNGTPGFGCTHAVITGNTKITGGSASHIIADDIDGLLVEGLTSRSSGADGIAIEATNASALTRNIRLMGLDVTSSTGVGIEINGQSATPSDNQAQITLIGCTVRGQTGNAIQLGAASKVLKFVTVNGCTAHDSGADGIVVRSLGGTINGNYAYSAAGDGIDITGSTDVWVAGNNCQDAGVYGVNADTTTDCTITGNNCRDAVTDGINRASSSGLRAAENVGDDAGTVGNVFTDFSSYSLAGASTGSIGFTGLTIPANTVKTGDMIRMSIFSNSGTSGTIEVRFGGTATASIVNTAGDSQVLISMRPATGGANTNFTTTLIRETGPTVLTGNGSAVVDWTVSQALTFQVTANAGGTTINGIFLEIMGSK